MTPRHFNVLFLCTAPRSKSWDAISEPDAPPMHSIFTVCDAAAAENTSSLAGPAPDSQMERA